MKKTRFVQSNPKDHELCSATGCQNLGGVIYAELYAFGIIRRNRTRRYCDEHAEKVRLENNLSIALGDANEQT